MLTKLLSLYPNAIQFPARPNEPLDKYYLFYDPSMNNWMGIPKSDLSDRELAILKTLYELSEPEPDTLSSKTKGWYDFLYLNGKPPADGHESYIRFIQFLIQGDEVDPAEIEFALKGFFSDKILIIWENKLSGVVIESCHRQMPLMSDKELTAMADTLESDLYIKVFFYIGKQYPFSKQLPACLQVEKEYFNFAQNTLGQVRLLSFERIFPAYMAFHLPEALKEKLNTLTKVFVADPDMYSTIKVFLENNLNASLTAKKLYIHRNTLQYRLDKFDEKAGIQLKDFYTAFTVFLACLIFEQNKDNLHKS